MPRAAGSIPSHPACLRACKRAPAHIPARVSPRGMAADLALARIAKHFGQEEAVALVRQAAAAEEAGDCEAVVRLYRLAARLPACSATCLPVHAGGHFSFGTLWTRPSTRAGCPGL
uniref:Uncharacterized protein n=1 Tax=Alexandrium monilatum TaxID=311494 RepID=A0A7S4R728_9DINO